jgi:hypothetical protein
MIRALVIVIALASTRPAHAEDRLAHRTTLIPAFGLVYMQIEGITNGGMAIQPTLTHTFDRLELQTDYTLADLRDEEERMPGSYLHRIGFAARYQAARLRVDRNQMTLDFVVEGGIGFQYLEFDNGDVMGRNDLSVGIGLRMLVEAARGKVMGIEMMFRGLVTPSGDKAFVFAFGVPFGS